MPENGELRYQSGNNSTSMYRVWRPIVGEWHICYSYVAAVNASVEAQNHAYETALDLHSLHNTGTPESNGITLVTAEQVRQQYPSGSLAEWYTSTDDASPATTSPTFVPNSSDTEYISADDNLTLVAGDATMVDVNGHKNVVNISAGSIVMAPNPTPPPDPSPGATYFNTVEEHVYMYNGTMWMQMIAAPAPTHHEKVVSTSEEVITKVIQEAKEDRAHLEAIKKKHRFHYIMDEVHDG